MFDNPRKSLHRMEDELLDEELEDILYGNRDEEAEYEEDYEEYRRPRRRPRPRRQQPDFRRAVYEDEDDDESRYMLLPKKKGCKGLVFLAILELIAILAVLGWWVQWLI